MRASVAAGLLTVALLRASITTTVLVALYYVGRGGDAAARACPCRAGDSGGKPPVPGLPLGPPGAPVPAAMFCAHRPV